MGPLTYVPNNSALKFKLSSDSIALYYGIYQLKYVTMQQIDKLWSAIRGKDLTFSRRALTKALSHNGLLRQKGNSATQKRAIFWLAPNFHTWLEEMSVIPRHKYIPYSIPNHNYHDELLREAFCDVLYFMMKNTNFPVNIYPFDIHIPAERNNFFSDNSTTIDTDYNYLSDLTIKINNDVIFLELDNRTESSSVHISKIRRYATFMADHPELNISLMFISRDDTAPSGPKRKINGVPFRFINNLVQGIASETYVTNTKDSPIRLNAVLNSLYNCEIYFVSFKDSGPLISSRLIEVYTKSATSNIQLQKNAVEQLSLYMTKYTQWDIKNISWNDYSSNNFTAENADVSFDGFAHLSHKLGNSEKIGLLFCNESSYKDIIKIYDYTLRRLNFLSNQDNEQNSIPPILVVYLPREVPVEIYTCFDYEKIAAEISEQDFSTQPFHVLTLFQPILQTNGSLDTTRLMNGLRSNIHKRRKIEFDNIPR